MKLLQDIPLEQAYAKIGIHGFQGSGKTITATSIAIGLCLLEKTDKAAFVDTETGSDFVITSFTDNNIRLLRAKTRAFVDLLTILKECENERIKVLIIDSITHIWRDLHTSYKTRKGKKYLNMNDWGFLKDEWYKYTDLFINSKIHIVVCGRAGFSYDHIVDDDGKMEIIKTGTKMKAENEFEFEPSLVIEMEAVNSGREEALKIINKKQRLVFKPQAGCKIINRAFILKDRWQVMNGTTIDYPCFDDFLPHIQKLNIGGNHRGIDESRTSEDMFQKNTEETSWQKEAKEREIIIEKIMACLVEKYPSTGAKGKTEKAKIIKSVFRTGSWTKVKSMSLTDLQNGLKSIKRIIDPLITADQIKAIHALYKATEGITNHDVVRAKAAGVVKLLNLKSMKDLTNKQGREIIDHLKSIEENKAVQQPDIEMIRKKIKNTWLFEIDALEKPKFLELLNARLDKPIERIVAVEMEEKSLLILHEIFKERGVYKDRVKS